MPDVLDLTAPQSRVLGCLMEKQATTPEAYPLTLKALTTACNQTSSRHPVVDYDTQLVETTSLAGGGVLPTGVYELRLNAPEVDSDSSWWQNRNVLLVVADTNLVVKEMFGEVNVWATNLATGEPTAGQEAVAGVDGVHLRLARDAQ